MKTNTEAKKEQTPKTTTTTTTPAQNGKAKTPKAKKESAPKAEVKADTESEPVDRLPTTIAELKESKSGLVTFLFLSGREKDEIAKELQATFKLAESQAVKIVRR
ncbi:MAG TPA: hypothetical protein PKJ98_20900, partial [Verrucomicrobiota bacterium]|nr:hypothetical protein [Verrucomicrobiota bacterium]